MQLQAVLFDLYETLVTEFSEGRRKVDREEKDYERRLGVPNDAFRRSWSARSDRRMRGELPHFADVVREIAAEHGREAPPEAIDALYRERVSEKQAAFEPIDDTVVAMLERLKAAGLKLALVSNATEEEVQGWAGSRLAPFFDEVVFSYEAGLAKPDPRIYELACSRLGVAPSDCAFVGDGGFQELDGAAAAGHQAVYQCVWFVPEKYRKPSGAAAVVETPEQLLQALGL